MKNENEIGHLKKKTCKKLDEKIAKLIFLSLFSFFFPSRSAKQRQLREKIYKRKTKASRKKVRDQV